MGVIKALPEAAEAILPSCEIWAMWVCTGLCSGHSVFLLYNDATPDPIELICSFFFSGSANAVTISVGQPDVLLVPHGPGLDWVSE